MGLQPKIPSIGDVTNATADSIVPPGTKPLVFNKKDLLPDKLRLG